MKIDDDWLIFCPVSLRGKTLEMATSTIPWQSSAYSFLRDKRESDTQAGQTSRPPANFYVGMHFPSRIYKEFQGGKQEENSIYSTSSLFTPRTIFFFHGDNSQYSQRTTKPIIYVYSQVRLLSRGSAPSGPRPEFPQDAQGQKTSQGSLYQPSNSGSRDLLHQTLFRWECAPEELL